MFKRLLAVGMLSTATVTHAFQLCESDYKACIAVRCDAAYYSGGVDGFVDCTRTCEQRYESCKEDVRSYQ